MIYVMIHVHITGQSPSLSDPRTYCTRCVALPSVVSTLRALFMASKQTATDLCARLGAQRFEELQLMKYAWKQSVIDFAECNSAPVKICLTEYEDLFTADKELQEFYN